MEAQRRARRVAALYDIHGNLFALDAALAEISQLQVDLIVVGGDLVWGPYPQATLRRLLDLGDRALFIRGNADRDVAQPPRTDTEGDRRLADEVTRFCSSELAPRQIEWLMHLPLTETVDIEGLGSVLFCHASPRSDEEILTPRSTDEHIREAARGMKGIIVCGHTHVQFDHDIGDIRLINAGSIGMPYEDLPGAYWTLFDSAITPRRTSYSVEEAATSIRESGCPHVEAFFVDTILNSPGREDALDHFAQRAAEQSY